MKHATIIALAAAGLTALVTTSPANAWERHRTVVGPYGGSASFHGRGSCANGRCSSMQTWTGPAGRTVTRNGSSSCYGGVCSGSATYTGPRGGSFTRSRSFRRY